MQHLCAHQPSLHWRYFSCQLEGCHSSKLVCTRRHRYTVFPFILSCSMKLQLKKEEEEKLSGRSEDMYVSSCYLSRRREQSVRFSALGRLSMPNMVSRILSTTFLILSHLLFWNVIVPLSLTTPFFVGAEIVVSGGMSMPQIIAPRVTSSSPTARTLPSR